VIRRVLIVGAGGHGLVVADALLRSAERDRTLIPIGYVDDDVSRRDSVQLGLRILGGVGDVGAIPHDGLVVAIGDSSVRKSIFDDLRSRGEHLIVVRHPASILAPDIVIGDGTMICAGVVVNPGSAIGANVILNTGCTIDHHNAIGDHVHVAPGVHTGGSVRIGEGALVGIGATIMPGMTIGAWSVVAAGAVVHRPVGERVVAVGAPANVVREL
jgi:sugar O-acyltransferase (sialic acid O-acetyltransferase NeuD family)